MPSTIKITTRPDINIFGRKFSTFRINPFLQNMVKEFAYKTEAETKKVTPVDTGLLRSSIGTSFSNLGAEVSTSIGYSVFVHEGTKYMVGRPFFEWGFQKAIVGFEDRMAKLLEAELQHHFN